MPNPYLKKVGPAPKTALYQLFVSDGNAVIPKAEDCVQGQIGNCWMHQTFSSLADDRPYNLVDRYQADYKIGAYTLRIWDGRAKKDVYVLIDDFLPTNDLKQPIFGRLRGGPGRPPTLWISLMEKFIAKISGGWARLRGGITPVGGGNALEYIMGTPATYFKWDSLSLGRTGDNYKIWQKIWNIRKQGKVLSVASSPHSSKSKGMVAYHGYGFLAMKDLRANNGEVIRLIKLRNTWGYHEWSGAWSDGAPEWNRYPEIKEKLNHSDRDDGVFWMAYSDFLGQFQSCWYA
eukprot:CAMPEP_0167759112 /NCGR_PEP_ID=MMETSP0110_2-20121227/10840_1 /TAXON_ID=629695 /ORGANISM="Gymnochlora sp., Strain CCMP2014" /LENGTH=288 /DNA_ID=CAMNT_0007645457 /DNA_START=873 /DNA_END=1739 /DNA_ORIENTATION=+